MIWIYMAMKKLLLLTLSIINVVSSTQPLVVINQYGYRPGDRKIAFLKEGRASTFEVIDLSSQRPALSGKIKSVGMTDPATGDQLFTIDFSRLKVPGRYQIWIPDLQVSSPEFAIAENAYWIVLHKTLQSFYYQRCGTEVANGTVWSHPACHLDDAAFFEKPTIKKDVTGGWHDAGDYGKFIATGALSAAFLLYAYELRPNNFADGQLMIPESANRVPDLLDEVRWELEWLLKMQREDGGVFHKTSTKKWTGEYLPHQDPDKRYIFPVSSTATAAFAAVTALGARIMHEWDKALARRLLKASIEAWGYLQNHDGIIPAGGFKNPPGVQGGEYGDDRDTDERLWAAVELYRLTKKPEYHTFFLSHYRSLGGFHHAISWQNVQNFAYTSYLKLPKGMQDQGAVAYLHATLISFCDQLLKRTQENGYRSLLRGEEYYWGSNSVALGYAFGFALAHERTGRSPYAEAALDQLHYVLGRNTFGQTFVTGVGSNPPRRPYHQFSMMLGVGEPVPGLVVGGPNKNSTLRGMIISPYPGKCYEDNPKNYFVNEVAINYTAPLTYVATYFTELSQSTITRQATNRD